MQKNELELELESVIRDLAQPLPEDEVANGWTPQAQAGILKLLNEIKEKLKAGTDLPDVNMVYGLDHWGVQDGPLQKKLARFSVQLGRYRGGSSRWSLFGRR